MTADVHADRSPRMPTRASCDAELPLPALKWCSFASGSNVRVAMKCTSPIPQIASPGARLL